MNADEIRDKHQRSAEGRAGCGVPAIFMVRAARRNVPEDRAERSMCVFIVSAVFCFSLAADNENATADGGGGDLWAEAFRGRLASISRLFAKAPHFMDVARRAFQIVHSLRVAAETDPAGWIRLRQQQSRREEKKKRK